MYCIIFFFKQKTAYEMRISDWSSDVCSSDLRLKALRDLPYDKHKIKLEICIFHDLCSGLGAKDEDDRHKYNLLETVKSTYAHAKEGGADVVVRDRKSVV